ncbi:hypothetical protein BOTBODRAFT_178707 [Botryobasidium botryosum FD-172 SS1]|uniref:Uncharacterized protein n=1 Tax=Botryobasidium botryosum (strain FD-172 SS1) TaxID=930990 RepID=A0A067MDZ0_BOTB1|nr:hypothetical protein BOTBODRAFT_178707 [Botryobasidium botryosum FD-172 SS1]
MSRKKTRSLAQIAHSTWSIVKARAMRWKRESTPPPPPSSDVPSAPNASSLRHSIAKYSRKEDARVIHNLRRQVTRAKLSCASARVEASLAKQQAAKALRTASTASMALSKAYEEMDKKINRVTGRLHKEIAELQAEQASRSEEIVQLRAEMTDEIHKLRLELKKLRRSLCAVTKRVEKIQTQKLAMKRKINVLCMGNDHALVQQQKAVAKAGRHRLKTKGVVNPRSRDMIRRLLGSGTSMARVNETVDIVLDGMGQKKMDSIDRRSVSRINREGGVAAKIQIVYELNKAKACSISSDATTHKHINYKSKHMMLNVPDYNAPPDAPVPENTVLTQRFLGINTAVNHTSETQLEGWKDAIETMFAGMNTNHAEDQKKLFRIFENWKERCEQELLGEETLRLSELGDIHPILWEEITHVMNEAGGQEVWDALPLDQKERRQEEAHQRACARIGKERIDAMTPEQRRYIALFIWGGCCMHKEMNSIKGGAAAMAAYWKERGLQGPMKLVNKDNRAAAEGGDAAQKERVMEAAQGGAIKLASLAGSVFAHKDKKKGQQDTLQSYCDATVELITCLKFYREFLKLVRDLKDKRAFTNMEKNIYNALFNIPTLTELCVLVLYSQTISCPAMRTVHGPNQARTNLLELGPELMGVIAHIDKLNASIGLALGPEATYETGVLDGKPWERPNAFYAVQALAPTLPHLEGARATWVRFTSEFEQGRRINSASASERHLAFMKPTNDDNEGALAAFKQGIYHTPRLTTQQFSATKMYRQNNTYSFMKHCFEPEDHQSVMQQARVLDGSGIAEAERAAQAKYYAEVQAKKQQDDADRQAKADTMNQKLDGLVLHRNVPDLIVHPPTCAILNLELDWHRRNGDKKVPMKKNLKRKANKVYALAAAVERYHSPKPPQHSLEDIASSAALPEVSADPIDDDFSESEDEDYCC